MLRLKLVCTGVSFGKRVRALGGGCPEIRISSYGAKVTIGRDVTFNNYNDAGWNSKCALWVKRDATLCIGNCSGFNGVLIYSGKSVVIGDNVKIGGGTRIFDTDFHPLEFLQRRNTNNGTKTAPITIDDDVFIGAGCIICKGVHIGARSIIAAGSVVVKNVPDDEVWGGIPQDLLRKLINTIWE